MKKLGITVRIVVVILFLVVIAKVIPQIILGLPQIFAPDIKNSHSYILTAFVLIPLCYLFLFYYGFV